MVKSVEFLSQTIINYLGEERLALLCAYTDIFPDERLSDGVLWIQLDENDITSVAAVGDKGKTLVFTSEKTDFTELSFILGDKIASPDKLPFNAVDKKYLLNVNSIFDSVEKDADTEDFVRIKMLETHDMNEALHTIAPKIYRAKRNDCKCAVITENGEIISGGFVSRCGDFSVITDVFTKSEYRKKGNGTALVKKLLKLFEVKKTYLLCEEKNLKFYEKIGFEIVKSIYEYEKS